MAHFDFILRGNRVDTNKFLNNVESMYFPTVIKKGKKKEEIFYNVALRPIQLWEAIAKKEDMPTVIKTINPRIRNPYISKYAAVLRRMLKLKKVPKIKPDQVRRAIWYENMEIFPIGYKEDKIDEDGNELL